MIQYIDNSMPDKSNRRTCKERVVIDKFLAGCDTSICIVYESYDEAVRRRYVIDSICRRDKLNIRTKVSKPAPRVWLIKEDRMW